MSLLNRKSGPVSMLGWVLVLGILLGSLTGCAVSRESPASPVDPPDTFSDTGTVPMPRQWWTTFEDTRLNQLVDQSLQENFDLMTAWNRLRAARAVVRRESSSLYPTLDAFTTGILSENDFNNGTSGSSDSDDDELQLGLTSEYEVDLWGRIQSSIQAERFRARATMADYRTAGISLSAEISRTWYQWVEQHRQRRLINRQIETNQKVLDLIRSRFARGQVGSADLYRQQQLIESTREQRILVESRMQVLEHQLAVLLGKPPQSGVEYQPNGLPDLPRLPKTGLPVELLRRRPDVRSAFHQLRAADQDLAAAISNQYPRLTLTASVSSSDNGGRDLFEDWARRFTADLTAPLLDGGRREAELERTRSVKMQRLYDYAQTILVAFREVEDALIQEKKQRQRIRSLNQQLELANRTIERLRFQYLNGTGDFLDVLQALTEQQQLRRDQLSARLELLERRIALYRALAGGFEMKQPPESMIQAERP